MFTSLVFLKLVWKTRHKSEDMKHLPIIAVLFFLSDGCKITESERLLNTFSKIWLIWKSCEYDKKELYLYKKYKTIKYGLFQYQCSPPLNGKSIRNEIPAYRSEVTFIQIGQTITYPEKKQKKLGNFQILRFIPFDRGILQTFLVFQKLRSKFADLGFLQAGVPR